MIDQSVKAILEFLVENRAFDYSKEEIAKGSEISRPTLYRIWNVLEGNGIIEETRKYGNTQLYKINEKNELVKLLIKLEEAAVREQFKRMKSKNRKVLSSFYGVLSKKSGERFEAAIKEKRKKRHKLSS